MNCDDEKGGAGMTENQMTETELAKQIEMLAQDILLYSRNSLLVNLRFLDAALYRFGLNQQPKTDGTIATDGNHFYYNPKHILAEYKEEKESVIRDYLHMLLHCVFIHPFIGPDINPKYWDLACDIAIENSINDLGLDDVRNQRQLRQTELLEKLRKEVKTLTAEKLYRYFLDQELSDVELAGMRAAFKADDHYLWYAAPEQKKIRDSGGKDDKDTHSQEDSSGQNGEGNSKAETEKGETNAETSKGEKPSAEEVKEEWKEISDRMQVDLETASREWGKKASGMMQELKYVNREEYDYSSFLRRFMSMGEAMQINDEEFDAIFYTYGLQLYRKMPLIEPLEYKETKRIKELALAIDTSGSCAGDVVQTFVQKTYNILKQNENFFTKINLHIIQCDAEIQEDVKICSQEEFDKYLESMKIKGLGGTDFRPVFRYVDQLVENKEFTNLKGLIYFTDGYGEFPERMPDYDAAFVFLDDEYSNPEVPSWAIRLVLSEQDLYEDV